MYVIYFHFDGGITGLRFLSVFVQGLNLASLFKILRCLWDQKAYWPKNIIPQLPGWLKLIDSRTVSAIDSGIATLSSIHADPDRT